MSVRAATSGAGAAVADCGGAFASSDDDETTGAAGAAAFVTLLVAALVVAALIVAGLAVAAAFLLDEAASLPLPLATGRGRKPQEVAAIQLARRYRLALPGGWLRWLLIRTSRCRFGV